MRCRYGERAVYRPHVDGSWPGSGLRGGRLAYDAFGDRWSRLTFLVYLNDDFTGGETVFYYGKEKLRVAPKTGAALVFVHKQLHEGAVLETGVKYVMRSDVMYGGLGDAD